MTIKISGGDDGPASDPLVAAIRQLGVALDRYDEAAGRSLGIGRSDLRALNLLEHGPLTAGEIGARLDLTSGSVTALVNRLVASGYVRRVRTIEDRRVVKVELREGVYESFARVYAPCGHAVALVSSQLGPEARSSAVRAILDAAEAVLRTRDALADKDSDLR
ncbi:MAG: MarR family winged helix-turn-helix transcriptional regulator [Mycolicibacterium sp.]|uniref:MarR family winged helix-turn-helix transcriptional regulator n=1 Tax=Mycolicibacterium sp. TaxID=2320850 RepID=UPI003D0D82D3